MGYPGVMNTVRKIVAWALDTEWAVVASTIAAIILLIPDIVTAISDGISSVEPGAGFTAVVMAVMMALIRSRVWSKASVSSMSDAFLGLGTPEDPPAG